MFYFYLFILFFCIFTGTGRAMLSCDTLCAFKAKPFAFTWRKSWTDRFNPLGKTEFALLLSVGRFMIFARGRKIYLLSSLRTVLFSIGRRTELEGATN
ncbi:hypothetical protein F4811DRAFT_525258 [Daldinia bambusicola]|nr:hypothetical protein F4811DRAFT_525258 [Daldinia bambusicola]